jgi:hypothetical protein
MVETWIRNELARRYRHASDQGARAAASEPRAISARYDAGLERIIVELTNGCQFVFPPGLVQGLAGAPPEAVAKVTVTPAGGGLHWEHLDVDLSVPNLALGIFGTRAWMRELGRRGGARRSQAKARASRKNGRQGGRPARTTKLIHEGHEA